MNEESLHVENLPTSRRVKRAEEEQSDQAIRKEPSDVKDVLQLHRVQSNYNRSYREESPDFDRSEKTPYMHRPFQEFVQLVARAFYDDACVVILELLASHQKAYTEADLRDMLCWRDSLIHSKLVFLDQQLVLRSHQCVTKGPRSPVYWSISQHIVHAIKHHSNELLEKLKGNVDDSEKLAEFCCPSCETAVSALDIMSGPRRISDGNPLCQYCPNEVPLVTSSHDLAKTQAKQQLHRAEAQLAPIFQEVRKLITMEIPRFELWTRASKNDQSELQRYDELRAEEDARREGIDQQRKHEQTIAKSVGLIDMKTEPREPKLTAAGAAIPWFQHQSTSKPNTAIPSVNGSSSALGFVGPSGRSNTSAKSVPPHPPPGGNNSDVGSSLSKKRTTVSFVFGSQGKRDSGKVRSGRSAGDQSKLSLSNIVNKKDAQKPPTQVEKVPPPVEEVPQQEVEISLDQYGVHIEAKGRFVTVMEVQADAAIEEEMNDKEYELYSEQLELYESALLKNSNKTS